ncbi:hypothetical protein D915_006932 [Fasciola hepatica]|uniref:IRS-type PTB domain-containing protein n=1 Tax=Fasciola hepatica TaxID=6192 RepID=A0A2H1C4T6_FASHE|nr:hypothetical protein D915_006932 [Fasciola hepatica]
MGALQSLLDAPIDGFPTKTRRNSKCCCHACGMQFDRNQKDSTVNQTLWVHAHYLAELCGIWLGSPDPSQRKHIDSSSPFVAFPSTTLPKRSVSSSKPSAVVSTLIKHTDFTKNERSALKHGFFSTMDMNTAGLTGCSGLEGCHIRGCLYVEHGSLVFQAADSSHQLPSVLTSRKGESFDAPGTIFPDINARSPCGKGARRTQTRGSDPITPGPDLNDYVRFPSIPHSVYRKTQRKLWAYFHEGRCSSPSRHRESGYCTCRRCRRDPKSTEADKPVDLKCPNVDYCTTEQPYCRSSTLRRRDTNSIDPDNDRLPPPPLRLSWPLCTLRRFGFYGNTLFKLEAGRRAPRGEGHYLFRIRNLRDFRQYFEHFVHRRKSLSPPNFPFDHTMKTDSSRLGTRLAPTSRTEPEPQCPETESICVPVSIQTYPVGRNALCDSIPRSLMSGFPVESEVDLKPCHSHLLSPEHLKQKANSLTHSSRGSKVSPNCLDWVRQQQEQQQKHQQSRRLQPNQLQASDSDQHSRRSVGFQSSCPHLSSTFITTTTNTTSIPNKRSALCVDSETDDLISLPEPPPPPLTNFPSFEGDSSTDLSEAQKLYDNIDLDWLRLSRTTSERRPADRIEETGSSREWSATSGAASGPRGRLYTSRRAMTAFACSNLYPIPSRHHEEEEAEDDDAIGKSIHSVKVEPIRQQTSMCRVQTESSKESDPSTSCSLHYHTGSFQSSSQTLVHDRRPEMGSHLRHTSLPNPISMDILFAVSRASGSCSQPNDAHEALSNVKNTTLMDRCAEESQQHLPYYNLSSPEALGQLQQTGRSSRSASMRIGQVFPDYGPIIGTIESDNQKFSLNDGNSRITSLCQSSFNVQDDLYVVPTSTRSQMHSCADLITQEAPCVNARVMTTAHPERTEALVSLHYATLDFSPTPDRSQSSVDLRGTNAVVCTECTNAHPINEAGNVWDGRSAACPMRVYGTFVHDPMGHSNNSGSRIRSLSSSGAPTVHPSSMDNTNNELPANYVAICQLQTLAMRAVLNATT